MTMGRFAFIYFIIFMIFFQINISNVISEEVIAHKILDIRAQGHLGSNATVQCIVVPVTSNVTWLFKGEPLTIDDVLYKIKITNFSINKDADGNERHNQVSSLIISKTSIEMHGNYTCQISPPNSEQPLRKQVLLDLRLKTRLMAKTSSPVKVNATSPVSISCEFEGFGLGKIKWRRSKDSQATSGEPLMHSINVNATNAIGTLNFTSLIRTDNGTYYCDARDPVTDAVVSASVDLLVIDKPEVSIEYIKAVGATRIYLNWTVNDGNLPIESYTLQYKNGSETWTYYNTPIGGGNLSFVIGGLTPSTPYQLKLIAKNKMGNSKPYMDSNVIKTLANDPHFVPNVTIKGFSMSSMTIGWPPPSPEQAVFVHYYELAAQEQNNTNSSPKEAIYSGGSSYLPYMFDNLLPATTYIFKVRACSELTRECGNWSEPTLGSTLDGPAGPPSDVTLSCNHDIFTHSSFLLVEWKPPAVPNGQIEIYNLEVTGMATYINAEGKWENATWGPKVRHVRGSHARFDNMPSNTNFTVSVSAVTRIKRPGLAVTMHCATPPSVPLRDTLRVKWDKVFDDGKFMFKLQVPRVTERNGAICCYRVFIVRIPWGQRLGDLPSPEKVPVVSYQQAHDTKKVGAYVAEIFTSDNVYIHSHVIVGDGNSPTSRDAKSMQQCMRCVASIQRALTTTGVPVPVTTTTGATAAQKDDDDDFLGEEKEQMDQPAYGWVDYGRGKRPVYQKKYQNNRSYLEDNRYSELLIPDPDQRLFKRQTEKEFKTENFDRIMSEFPQDSDTERLEVVKGNEVDVKGKETDAEMVNSRAEENVETQTGVLSWQVFDGHLDTSSNYTGFVEMIVHTANDDLVFPAYTDYFPVLKPGPTYVPDNNEAMLELILKVVCGVLSVVLVCLFFICVYHTHQRRKEQQGLEMQTLHATLRNLCQGLKGGRHQLVAHSPPDMPPIAKDELAAAYLERSADSDYGFQREFELLPDCFPDRTMHASEARENTSKNRYPDIKAYDQTRVKLSQIDSIVGSDYINANFVMGYKERKRFICAQGPTDATVTDFWRMIWEQNLDLVVMLTNLEEYSKVKCSKYWPDEAQGEKVFDSISVQHLSEKRYSDYIVRELKVTRQKPVSTAESSPIVVENNGIAKRNGATSDMLSTSSSSPSSPKDTGTASGRPEQATSPQLSSMACGERVVRQYHFLMWKDFVAPEYPQAILKFIHRVNAAWSACLTRPLLVHCSAGVGRTGTLVALDCLLQQLCTERNVAVFNTVADLRRQRNFLVQSLKQYIFVYRALVEYAQYGDTEIPASKLKTTVDRLRNTPEGGDCCLMEEEFERIKKPALPEPLKSCAAGGGEENACKNRCEASLPFDRNRVILTPVPGRDYSTYINATFIEGYDNSESYIITQDPLPNTVSDFWRMISEQGATTIVMLSELGEGERKCPRYWDDGSVQYEHITVQYEHSESCPYYTKREFRVTNSKSQEWLSVRQLQYHGWPTVAGQVPEVTRGLAELADAASRFPRNPAAGPMVVHCNLGTERSSMFVALCTLITQLRVERRVDVAALARKIRSQRSGCLDTFLQYEFLHRAIVNYAELHNLLEDS